MKKLFSIEHDTSVVSHNNVGYIRVKTKDTTIRHNLELWGYKAIRVEATTTRRNSSPNSVFS